MDPNSYSNKNKKISVGFFPCEYLYIYVQHGTRRALTVTLSESTMFRVLAIVILVLHLSTVTWSLKCAMYQGEVNALPFVIPEKTATPPNTEETDMCTSSLEFIQDKPTGKVNLTMGAYGKGLLAEVKAHNIIVNSLEVLTNGDFLRKIRVSCLTHDSCISLTKQMYERGKR